MALNFCANVDVTAVICTKVMLFLTSGSILTDFHSLSLGSDLKPDSAHLISRVAGQIFVSENQGNKSYHKLT